MPDVILRMPGDSLAPLLLSIALAFRLRRHADALVVAVRHRHGARRSLATVVWLWPEAVLGQTMDIVAWTRRRRTRLYGGEPLPVGSKGRLSSGWWGMIAVIAHRGVAVRLPAVQLLLRRRADRSAPWPPGGPPELDARRSPGTVVLLLGSVTMWWGEKGVRAGRRGQLLFGLGRLGAAGDRLRRPRRHRVEPEVVLAHLERLLARSTSRSPAFT